MDHGSTLAVKRTYRCPNCNNIETGFGIRETSFARNHSGVRCLDCGETHNMPHR